MFSGQLSFTWVWERESLAPRVTFGGAAAFGNSEQERLGSYVLDTRSVP